MRARTPCIAAMSMVLVAGVAGVARTQVVSPTPRTTVDTATYRNRLLGVFDAASGKPLEGASITDLRTGVNALTTRTGTVSLWFIPEGSTFVQVLKMGFAPQVFLLTVARDEIAPITIPLDKAVELPAMITTATGKPSDRVEYASARLQGFEERRAKGFGYFISEAELRQNDGHPLSSFLVKHLLGLQVSMPSSRGSEQYAYSLRGQNSMSTAGTCFITVYEDGALIYDRSFNSSAKPPDLNYSRLADMYAGIEYYPGGATVPPEYNPTGSGCGVLLLWTRER